MEIHSKQPLLRKVPLWPDLADAYRTNKPVCLEPLCMYVLCCAQTLSVYSALEGFHQALKGPLRPYKGLKKALVRASSHRNAGKLRALDRAAKRNYCPLQGLMWPQPSKGLIRSLKGLECLYQAVL